MKKFLKKLSKNKVLITFVLLALLFRIIFLSDWLEDWDSVQFALGMDNFSLELHQPHPPGYIGYLYLAKMLNFFLNDKTLSLTLLSAISGAFVIIPFYLILKDEVEKKWAVASSLLLVFLPIQWILSEVALSNIPGLFSCVLSVYFLFRGRKSFIHLIWGSIFSGLTLGVRFAEYSIVLALFSFVLLERKNIRDVFRSIPFFLLGVFLWLIPLILKTGIGDFFNLYRTQVNYIFNHDSVFGIDSSLSQRLIQIWDLYKTSFTIYTAPLILIAGITFFKKRKLLKNFSTTFALVWLFSYLIPLIFIYNLEVPRHLLPLSPPIILLSVLYVSKIKNRLVFPLFLLMLLMVFLKSFSLVKLQKNLLPPTISPIFYLKENFNPEETTLITTFIFRQVQYYLPQYENYWGAGGVDQKVDSRYVVIDFLNTKNDMEELGEYDVVGEKKFEGPNEIFPRVNETKLYFLERNTIY